LLVPDLLTPTGLAVPWPPSVRAWRDDLEERAAWPATLQVACWLVVWGPLEGAQQKWGCEDGEMAASSGWPLGAMSSAEESEGRPQLVEGGSAPFTLICLSTCSCEQSQGGPQLVEGGLGLCYELLAGLLE
jgi:hypothetical protein